MTIVYEYYTQGSSSSVAFGKSSSTYTIVGYNAINHVVVTPTVDCWVRVSGGSSAVAANTDGSAQFIGIKNQTPIPCIGARYVTVFGDSTSGNLYITEFGAE